MIASEFSESDLIRMRCAIYARFSSDLQRERSIDDQIMKCRSHAENAGWKVLEEHVYTDKAISGASMIGRAGLRSLLEAATSTPRLFDYVLADDTSRLSRKMGEVQDIFDTLRFYGIGVLLVSQGIDSKNEDSSLSAGFHGLIDHQHRRDLAKKTIRGMSGQAARGYNAGGRLYGYRSVKEFDPTGFIDRKTGITRILGARLEIDNQQAETVRQIFELYQAGLTVRDLAFQLNAKEVLPPHNARQLRRGTGRPAWLPNTIYLMLQNPRYKGDWSFNKTGWVVEPTTKKRRRVAKAPEEWQQSHLPGLAIVDQMTFEVVQQRIQKAKTGPQKRRIGAKSGFLLSGLMKCHECGGSYVVVHGTDRDKIVFGCCTNHKRGAIACGNGFKVSKDEVEGVILLDLQRQILDPAMLSALVKKVNDRLRTKLGALKRDSAGLSQRRAETQKRLTNVLNAIADHGTSPALLDKLREIESALAELNSQADTLAQGMDYDRLNVDEKFVNGWISRMREKLTKDVLGAKVQLMSLVGEFTLTPEMHDGVRMLRIDGEANLFGVLAVAVGWNLNQLNKYRGADLNCRHPVPQTGALTN